MLEFSATAVAAEEVTELNTFVVVFAEHSDGSGQRLEIQKALSFDEQDRASGEDTYCLCLENGACEYGGVTSWTLKEDSLEIVLSRHGADTLGVEGGFFVELSGERPANLRAVLQRLLGGTDAVVDR